MKITGVSNIYNAYTPQKTSDVKKKGKTEDLKDGLSISNTAKDYQTVARAVAKTPDIRQDKIDNIKARIQSGTYFVSDNDIADKIMA